MSLGGTVAAPLLAALVSCQCSENGMRTPETGGGPVAGASISAMEDGEWRMPSKDFQATRYSALDQITPENVRALRPVWNFSTGELRGHEAAGAL